MLTQIDPTTQHPVVLCHSSRALSDVESRYSQFDREMLAVVFGILKYHRWIYGAEVDVLSDNKALCAVLNSKASNMTARVERARETVSKIARIFVPNGSHQRTTQPG
jgi:hypothetical protein